MRVIDGVPSRLSLALRPPCNLGEQARGPTDYRPRILL